MSKTHVLAAFLCALASFAICEEALSVSGQDPGRDGTLDEYVVRENGDIDYKATADELEAAVIFKSVSIDRDEQGRPRLVVVEFPVIERVELSGIGRGTIDLTGRLRRAGKLSGGVRFSGKTLDGLQSYIESRLLVEIDTCDTIEDGAKVVLHYRGHVNSKLSLEYMFAPEMYAFNSTVAPNETITGIHFGIQELSLAPSLSYSPLSPVSTVGFALGYYDTPYPLNAISYNRTGASLRLGAEVDKGLAVGDRAYTSGGLYATQSWLFDNPASWDDLETGFSLKGGYNLSASSNKDAINIFGSIGYRLQTKSLRFRYGGTLDWQGLLFGLDHASIGTTFDFDSDIQALRYLPVNSASVVPISLGDQRTGSLLALMQDQVFSPFFDESMAFPGYYSVKGTYILPPLFGAAIYDFAPYVEAELIGTRIDPSKVSDIGMGLVLKLNFMGMLKMNLIKLGYYVNIQTLLRERRLEGVFLLLGM